MKLLPRAIEPRVRQRLDAQPAVALFGPHRVLLTPDCGFATFADNPVASAATAEAKFAAVAQAARLLRRRHAVKD